MGCDKDSGRSFDVNFPDFLPDVVDGIPIWSLLAFLLIEENDKVFSVTFFTVGSFDTVGYSYSFEISFI